MDILFLLVPLSVVLVFALMAVFAWALVQAPGVLDGKVPTSTVEWVPSLGLSFGFRLDGFSLLMVLLVGGIGLLVQLYAAQYFGPTRPELFVVLAAEFIKINNHGGTPAGLDEVGGA